MASFMLKLRFIFLIAFAMFAVFGFAFLNRLTTDVEQTLVESAAVLNEDVPKKLDSYTDFIGARAEGKEIVYLFRKYGISPASIASSGEEFKANRLAVIKRDKNTKRLLSLGARMTYEYFVGDDLALQFSISEEELN